VLSLQIDRHLDMMKLMVAFTALLMCQLIAFCPLCVCVCVCVSLNLNNDYFHKQSHWLVL
jgi:hypothetical protein